MPEKTKIYRADGTDSTITAVDARAAVLGNPGEWSYSPFEDKEIRKFVAKEKRAKVEAGKADDKKAALLQKEIDGLEADLEAANKRADDAEAKIVTLEADLEAATTPAEGPEGSPTE